MDTTRVALLRAIATAPDDDLPRLVYADWLEEFGATDLDAATREFIRLSCRSKKSKLMPKAAYKWLKANWRRLVPEVCRRNSLICRQRGGQLCWYPDTVGRVVWFPVHYPYSWGSGENLELVDLVFDRGFLRQVKVSRYNPRPLQTVAILLRQDQPLVKFPNWFVHVNSGRDRVSSDPLADLKIPETAA